MKTPIKVLIVEDVPNDVELALRELRNAGIDHTAVSVDTRSGFLSRLAEEVRTRALASLI